jgi:hypothetical protein
MKALGFASFSIAALAAVITLAAPARADVSMTVQPLVTELNVAPGSSERIQLIVQNNTTQEERIVAHRTDWRTLADGSTTLERVGAERRHSITRALSLSAYQFELQPGERRTIALTLTVPKSVPPSPASYWGGFLISASLKDAPPSAMGIGATVFVYNNVGNPSKHLTLQSMRIVSGPHGAPTLIARMRNDGQAYARCRGQLLIEQAGRVVKTVDPSLSVIFPTSTRLLKQSLGDLPPGDYRIELTLDYGGNSIIDGITNAHIR